MRKYVCEFIGTFFLVMIVVVSQNSNAVGVIPPFAIGLIYMSMVYACGHISGAHFNPAVSLAMFMRKRMTVNDFTYYVAAQISGAVVASLVSAVLLSGIAGSKTPTPATIDVIPALLAEFLGTFALVWVVQNVATAKSTEGNSFYGLAIGMVVAALSFALGPISGGSFNPAVAVGVTVAEMVAWQNLWVYLVACIGGGAAAAVAYQSVVGENA